MKNLKSKKSIIAVILSITLLFALCACGSDPPKPEITTDMVKTTAEADPMTLIFEIEKEKAIITGYAGDDEIISIPEKINEFDVVKINENAFLDNKNLRAIIIPDTVTEIGYSAFGNCENLEIFIAGKNLKAIREKAFKNCISLREVILNDGLKMIKNEAFADCKNLPNIYIPATVDTIQNPFTQRNGNPAIIADVGSYAEFYASRNSFNYEVIY